MKELLNAFLNSLYNPEWLKRQRFHQGKAWTYFALFLFVFSIVVALPVALGTRPVFKTIQSDFVAKLPDFKATLAGGKLNIENLSQPFVYQVPDEKFVVVIDTKGELKPVSEYVSSTPEGSVLVSKNEVSITDKTSGSTKTQKWPSDASGTVTKQDLTNLINKILQPWFYFVILFVVFLGLYIAYFVSKLYSAVVVSLVVYISAKLSGMQYKWKELFTMSLYAITLPSIISVLFTLTGLGIPYVHFIALLAFMLAVVFTEGKKRKKKE
jgi:maltodextrin utilization protein YvdJ